MRATRLLAMAIPMILGGVMAGCPVPATGPGANNGGGGGGGGGGAKVDPNTCAIKGSDAGRKLVAFLGATVELDTQLTQLESMVRTSCTRMGTELALPADQMSGDTKTICTNVANAVKADLTAGLKANASFTVKYKPSVCTVNVDAAAQIAAQCEASAQANVDVRCSGTCEGTCSGACSGRCAAKNADGSCAGQCDGTCQGSCHGTCQGSADVQGDAQCQAAANVHANVTATCTDPVLDVTYDAAVVVDKAKVDMVKKAAMAGLPSLLMVAAKVNGPVQAAFTTWAKTAQDLGASVGDLAGAFGDQAICVTGQIGAAVEAMAHIQVEISVSVEASAEVGGACGATSG